MKKFIAFLIVFVAFLIPLSIEAKDPKSYKIGGVFAITGPASWLGEPERNTMMMVVDMINAKGGINGVPIEAVIEDTVGDETKTVNAVKKLINSDKVLAIIGPSRSGTTMAVIPIVERAQTSLISCAAAETIINPVKKWVFKTPQSDRDAVVRIYDYMVKHGITRVALISGTTGFGNAGRGQLKDIAPEFGIKIIADETYGPQDTDMTPQLTKIRGTNAQAIVNWSIVPAQAIVAKNMVQLGIDIPLFQSHGFGNIKYVEAAGKAAEGIIFPAGRLLAVDTVPASHPQKKVLVEYKTMYEKKFNDPVSTFGGHAWDAMWMVAEALKKAGADKEGIRASIETMKGFVGTGGVFNFSPTDHYGLTPDAFEMLTVKNGKFVVLQD
ncbi:MAG: ABC transporter substrate-binding protein [Spirochaetota bacterium]|nr:MAG: ABC transporter substrate-binding protein [Spirochaetota bacterium]